MNLPTNIPRRAKKLLTAQQRRAAVQMLVKQGLSQRRSCALVEMARASFEYRAHPRQDKELLQEIRAIARKHKRYGYRRAWALIRRKGKKVNVKRIRRLW